ncbi:MAG: 23S rRNA (guanosine(2251)-2'-O)-methyltransferase RlmB [Clostridia bacterium]
MAFYKDATKEKSRQEKKTIAEARGGFEDEGSEYRKGGRTSSFGRPSGARPQGGGYGHASTGAARPQGGGYGRSSEGAARPQGGGYGRSSEGSARPQGGGYGRPSGGARPQGGGYGRPSGGARPQGGGFGRPERDGGSERPRSETVARPSGFRDTTRATPYGERPPMERNAPRGDRKAGNYRFSSGEPSRYAERGNAITPRPYGEQRRARTDEDNRFDHYRYDAPAQYTAPSQQGVPVEEDGELVPNENLLSGRNPIREALKSGRDIEKLLVSRGELSGSAREIVQMAKERHIPVQEVDRARLDAITHNHQGMLAFASAYQYSTLEAMLELAKARNEAPFLVILDGITDPHNLGAIIRTAECAGAHGVLVQERRAVGLTPAAVKASAGAVEHLPVARVTNLSATIETLKAQNIWVYAADMDGEDYTKVDFSGALALVIGAEGEGVSRLVRESCDKTISLPLRGQLDSLNASVAAGILLYTAMRAR